MSETEKPNKRDRAKTRAISRLTKAMELASNAGIDAELAKLPDHTRIAVSKSVDGIKEALKAIFVSSWS